MADTKHRIPGKPKRNHSARKRTVLQHQPFGFDTRSIHAGLLPKTEGMNSVSSIPGSTHSILEDRLAALEGGEACLTTASRSLALFSLILAITKPGDNVFIADNKFEDGSQRTIAVYLQRCGVTIKSVPNPSNPRSWGEAIDEKTKLVWIESPASPLPYIIDIEAVADVAHSKGVKVLVNNSLATAALQRPIALGADLVLLSVPEFLSGHSSLSGGVLIGAGELIEEIRRSAAVTNEPMMPPTEVGMVLHSLATLSLRMQKHSSNAQVIGEFLKGHPGVAQVIYSGLPDHPQHELASYQMNGYGGLLSFIVKKGMAGATKVIDNLNLVVQESAVGTSHSSCLLPTALNHPQMNAAKEKESDSDQGLIRLSIGLENPEDIVADLGQALKRLN